MPACNMNKPSSETFLYRLQTVGVEAEPGTKLRLLVQLQFE
jgi:hypothetical protein